MAGFDSMNPTTDTHDATESDGYDPLEATGRIVGIIAGIIGPLLTMLGICLTYYIYKKTRATGTQQSAQDDPMQSEPLNAETATGTQPLAQEDPMQLEPLNAETDTVLRTVQEKLQNVYKNLIIFKGSVNSPWSQADVDELWTELQLYQAIDSTFHEQLTTLHGTIPVQIPYKILLDSWADLLIPEKIKNLMIILSGGAGFGKTTLFKKIAHNWSTSNQLAKFKFLFLIELNKMKTSSIINAILDQCFPKDERPGRADLIRTITDNQNESVFLLDGLDELPQSFLEPSEDTYCMYNVLRKQVLQQSRVLVSTRPHKVGDIIEGYPRSLCVETFGFTKDNTEQYISKYFRADEEKGRELIKTMETKGNLWQLAHIPLICQIVCHIFRFGKSQLPDRLTELYRTIIEFLARRRCRGEDWKQRLETALRVLGRVALDGLLDSRKLVLTKKEFDDCTSVLNEASGESGFIQLETYESLDGQAVIVTFLHKTFQEYCAAYYFVNLYHEKKCLTTFKKSLKQINSGNVHALAYLLRFACGISSKSPATGLIIKHVQKQHKKGRRFDKVTLQKLVHLLLFESGSDKMADKLDIPTEVECDGQEDLLAMHYYLQCLPRVELTCKYFRVHCRSHEDLVLLRDITGLLRDNTNVTLRFRATCRSYEGLEKLKQLLLSGYIRPMTGLVAVKPYKVTYVMSEQAEEEMQTIQETLGQIDEGVRDQLELQLEINEMSHIDDDYVLESLSRICNHIEGVTLRNRARHEDVIRLANAFDGCNKLKNVNLSDTNLHGHLVDLDSLVPRSLTSLEMSSCGLNDEDVPDLISILPAGHRLWWLKVSGNAFSVDGVQTLTAHLSNLPRLRMLWLDYQGPEAERVKQVVKQNLPNVTYFNN